MFLAESSALARRRDCPLFLGPNPFVRTSPIFRVGWNLQYQLRTWMASDSRRAYRPTIDESRTRTHSGQTTKQRTRQELLLPAHRICQSRRLRPDQHSLPLPRPARGEHRQTAPHPRPSILRYDEKPSTEWVPQESHMNASSIVVYSAQYSHIYPVATDSCDPLIANTATSELSAFSESTRIKPSRNGLDNSQHIRETSFVVRIRVTDRDYQRNRHPGNICAKSQFARLSFPGLSTYRESQISLSLTVVRINALAKAILC